jgi:uroporphyrinogen decarboxylase
LTVDEDEYAFYYTDEWGMRYVLPKPRPAMPYTYCWNTSAPLASAGVKDLEGYSWPDPRDPGRFEGLEETARRLYVDTEYALVMHEAATGIVETSSYLRGLDKFLSDLLIHKAFAAALMDRVLDFHLAYWGEMLDTVGEYVQVAFLSDDMGTQNGPMFSPKLYQEIIKPRHKKLCDLIRQRTKSVHMLLHSDGDIYPLIPHIIEAGFDAINPIQVSAKEMDDTALLKKRFGEQLTFWGAGCDATWTLPFGTVADVQSEVRRRLRDLALGGGLIFGSIMNILPEVPPKNIVTMFDAARKYGRYPIQIA